jgi:hypothetical protein
MAAPLGATKGKIHSVEVGYSCEVIVRAAAGDEFIVDAAFTYRAIDKTYKGALGTAINTRTLETAKQKVREGEPIRLALEKAGPGRTNIELEVRVWRASKK